MSILSALGSRPIQSPLLRSSAQDSAGAQLASAIGKLPVVDPVSASSGSVSLSQQALNARVSQLGDKTVDVAQQLIGNFAEALFGDAAKGATFNFNAISVSADTSLSAAVMHASDSSGSVEGRRERAMPVRTGVIGVHVLKNILIPIVTVIGLELDGVTPATPEVRSFIHSYRPLIDEYFDPADLAPLINES